MHAKDDDLCIENIRDTNNALKGEFKKISTKANNLVRSMEEINNINVDEYLSKNDIRPPYMLDCMTFGEEKIELEWKIEDLNDYKGRIDDITAALQRSNLTPEGLAQISQEQYEIALGLNDIEIQCEDCQENIKKYNESSFVSATGQRQNVSHTIGQTTG
jgi:hypothetical protein